MALSGMAKDGFTIKLAAPALAMIEQLKPLGIFGSNRAEIARGLIEDRLKQLLADGTVRPPPAA
jgi:hypothetical protein